MKDEGDMKFKLNTQMYFADKDPLLDGSAVKNICIFLHGLGANGKDLITIAHEWAPQMPGTLFLAPDAPTPYGDLGGFQWFDLISHNPEVMASELLTSAELLKVYIEEVLKYFSLTANNLALVGFSQGAAMALHVGLYSLPPNCIIGYSGGIFIQEPGAKLADIPVLLVHGTKDDVLPIDFLHATNHYLQSKGITPEVCVCEGTGHWIDREGLASGLEFLKENLIR